YLLLVCPFDNPKGHFLTEGDISMLVKRLKLIILLLALTTSAVMMVASSKGVKAQEEAQAKDDPLTQDLTAKLHELGFTGRIADTLEGRLGRRIDNKLANLGRLLWFDTIGGLNNDNTCAGCHSPTNGFGDTQSIAIRRRLGSTKKCAVFIYDE